MPQEFTVIKKNILIVDDHPFIIQGYKNAITRYRPTEYEFLIDQAKDCQSGYEVIVNPESPSFDIAFLDISMPAYVEKGIQKVLAEANIQLTINRVGSMISVHFDANPVYDFKTAANGDNETFKKFFHGLLKQGVYIAPSAYETWFITDALTYEDLDFTIEAVGKVAQVL